MSVGIVWTGMPTFAGATFTTGSQVTDTTAKHTIGMGIATLTGNYGTSTSHGDPCDFTLSGQTPPGAQPQGTNLGEYAPSFVLFFELNQAGALGTLFNFKYNPGPNISTPDGCTQAGGVIQIWGTGAASGQGGTEITEGSAYSTFTPSLNGVQLFFVAFFARA